MEIVFERPGKCVSRRKSQCNCNIAYWQIAAAQEPFGVQQTELCQNIVKCAVKILGEDLIDHSFTQIELLRDITQGDILLVVI